MKRIMLSRPLYNNIQNPAVEEVLVCGREPYNAVDQYSVAIRCHKFSDTSRPSENFQTLKILVFTV